MATTPTLPGKTPESITISPNATSGVSTPHPHHPRHTGRRLRQFLHPNGRRVHIALSPEDATSLSRRLSTVQPTDAEEWDIFVHGSPEHVEALRQVHTHHEQRRETIRQQLGDETAAEFEGVIRDLDSIASELHNVSEHTVQLDANFSKFGYSAHLRARDSPTGSSASSMYNQSRDGDYDGESERDWEAERTQGNHMVFWKRPVMRQYFHKGLLWRSNVLQETASYELFTDLFYVGIVAITGDVAAEHPNGQSLLRFVITFLMGWKFWSDLTLALSWFEEDSIFRRLSVLFVLASLLGLTTNMAEAWEKTFTPLVGFYLVGRFFNALYFLFMACVVPMVRGAMIGYCIVTVIPSLFWIGSIHVDEPNRQALIWIAIFLDLFGQIIFVWLRNMRRWFPNFWLAKWFCKHLEFFPGMNIEHQTERVGAFVTLIIGYSVIALLYQSTVKVGITVYFGKAVLGLVLAFSFNWLYFEIDSFNLHTHAIRHKMWTALIWTSFHVPFIMGFALAASAMSKIVLAHDTPDANPEDLWETYAARSEETIENGLRWYFCGGLAVALASMTLISWSHVYKTRRGERVKKGYRLAFRLAMAIIILLLPLAHGLTSLDLIAITTCLVVVALIFELAGATCVTEAFWLGGKRRCAYSAKCNVLRKELEASMREGRVLEVEEIAKRGNEKQNFDMQV